MLKSEKYTVPEAAKILDRTPANVRQHLPELGGRKIFGRWVLDASLVHKHAQGEAADPCLQSSSA
jgi:hypothetical protein